MAIDTKRTAASLSHTDVCACTITLARDENEGHRILRTLERLSEARLRVIVADGGSPPAFVDAIRRMPRVSVATPRQPSLVSQVQSALAAAAALGTRFVLYVESDKERFAGRDIADFIRRAPGGADVGAVLAARSAESFETFPAAQRAAETRINEMTGDAVGRRGDYSYGPFLLNSRLAGYVERAPASLGWGWRHFMFAVAHRLGYGVTHVIGDYDCPADQRHEDEEERRHRIRQLEQNLEGLRLGATVGL